jgi:hypothetical protein
MVRKHLTYANVMSSLAVFMLLAGGAAVAANQKTKRIGTNQIKASAIVAGKIKNGAVTNAKIANGAVDAAKLADGSVGTAKLSGQAIGTGQLQGDSVTGDKVVESSLSEVPSASSANPAAFAKVNFNGVVDAANSKGITSVNVTHPNTGVYCVTVPSFTPRGGQATTQFGGTGGTTAQLTVGGTGNCPAPAVQVLTWTTGPTAANDISFYVMLYR